MHFLDFGSGYEVAWRRNWTGENDWLNTLKAQGVNPTKISIVDPRFSETFSHDSFSHNGTILNPCGIKEKVCDTVDVLLLLHPSPCVVETPVPSQNEFTYFPDVGEVIDTLLAPGSKVVVQLDHYFERDDGFQEYFRRLHSRIRASRLTTTDQNIFPMLKSVYKGVKQFVLQKE